MKIRSGKCTLLAGNFSLVSSSLRTMENRGRINCSCSDAIVCMPANGSEKSVDADGVPEHGHYSFRRGTSSAVVVPSDFVFIYCDL